MPRVRFSLSRPTCGANPEVLRKHPESKFWISRLCTVGDPQTLKNKAYSVPRGISELCYPQYGWSRLLFWRAGRAALEILNSTITNRRISKLIVKPFWFGKVLNCSSQCDVLQATEFLTFSYGHNKGGTTMHYHFCSHGNQCSEQHRSMKKAIMDPTLPTLEEVKRGLQVVKWAVGRAMYARSDGIECALAF